MSESVYLETGGIRYGNSFWMASNFTWPFAHLAATTEQISIRVSIGNLWSRTFLIAKSQIKGIRKKPGLFSVGIEIFHSNADYPPYILYWTFSYQKLKQRLEILGYVLT